jgi:hypothetical protein
MDANSGFDRDDEWGFRAMEPSRCCISSIALVLLKTGIVHHPAAPNGDKPVTVDYNQMTTAQKLLLFWRKPAVCIQTSSIICVKLICIAQRKCWWDGIEIALGDEPSATNIKLWARRVWTLELSLVCPWRRFLHSSSDLSARFDICISVLVVFPTVDDTAVCDF